MAIADVKYKRLLSKVLSEGISDKDGKVRPIYKDGSSAHSISVFGEQVKFQTGEIPLITAKQTPAQSSINEVVHAFFRLKTNKLADFRELGIGYWDNWTMIDGTLGSSYGYQLANQMEVVKAGEGYIGLDQVDSILHRLKYDPYSRRIMFSYWNANDVNHKALQECAYAGQFNVRRNAEGRLQLDFLLIQRSVDLLLGLPSNWAGYYALQCALASVFDYEVGTFTHQMGNVHLYDNQVELAKELIEAPEFEQAGIYVNPIVTDFYDYGLDDIKYVDYKHGKSFRSEVAK